jgi:hypothetical protein
MSRVTTSVSASGWFSMSPPAVRPRRDVSSSVSEPALIPQGPDMFGAWGPGPGGGAVRAASVPRTDRYALLGAARRVDLVEGADRQEWPERPCAAGETGGEARRHARGAAGAYRTSR